MKYSYESLQDELATITDTFAVPTRATAEDSTVSNFYESMNFEQQSKKTFLERLMRGEVDFDKENELQEEQLQRITNNELRKVVCE